jgi:hypothetical protein
MRVYLAITRNETSKGFDPKKHIRINVISIYLSYQGGGGDYRVWGVFQM